MKLALLASRQMKALMLLNQGDRAASARLFAITPCKVICFFDIFQVLRESIIFWECCGVAKKLTEYQ